jgi:hypothetical protein
MYVKEIEYKDVDWTYVTHDNDQWHSVANMVRNLQVS